MVNDYRYAIGGAEVYMYSLKQALEDEGHSVEVFASNVTKQEYIRKQHHTTIGELLKRIWNSEQQKKFQKVYSQFQPDCIHIHSFFNELSPSFLSAIGNTPCVMTLHDERIAVAVTSQQARNGIKCNTPLCAGCVHCVGFKGMVFERVRRFVQSLVIGKVKLFIVPSMFLYKRILQYTSIRPLQQLYNGFQLLESKPLTFSKNIVFIGRLSEEKGVGVLIQAMKQVHKEIPDATLSIVGIGEELLTLTELTKKLSLEKVVTFYNEVPHNKVAGFIYKADIVCLPSTYPDNLPTVCIEAMSAGRPIVASRIGGLPELVENTETGILVEPGNAEALAKALVQLLPDKKTLHRFAEHAVKKSVKFEMNHHLKEIITIYKNYAA